MTTAVEEEEEVQVPRALWDQMIRDTLKLFFLAYEDDVPLYYGKIVSYTRERPAYRTLKNRDKTIFISDVVRKIMKYLSVNGWTRGDNRGNYQITLLGRECLEEAGWIDDAGDDDDDDEDDD